MSICLKTDEKTLREVRLIQRRVEWPTGTRRPTLTPYVHEGDHKRAVSYAWTEGDGAPIGVKLRWIQASCTLAPERVFDDAPKSTVRQ